MSTTCTRGKEILECEFYSERFGSAPVVIYQMQGASRFSPVSQVSQAHVVSLPLNGKHSERL